MNFASEFIYAKKRDQPKPQPANFLSFGNNSTIDDDSGLDTNVVSAKFDQLVERSNTYTGDYYPCSNCGAILSCVSKVSQPNPIDNKRVWKCDFCTFENKLKIEKEEIPNKEEVTYILEESVEKHESEATDKSDAKYLIYCIDISGSMSVTTEVSGNFNLPTDEYRREKVRNATGESMYMSRTKHISRLEAVQVAIEDNLTKLEKNSPEKKIGLIAFNQYVNIIGDGKMSPIKMIEIDTKEEIKKIADRTPEFENIQNNKSVLSEKLLNLEEGGATALGPALYYSILIASRKKGSQVILCTDGLANKGIGSLENDNSKENSTEFYNEMADIALESGISVSIITIEGTNCKLGVLGEIANKTGGTVNIVNPLKIKEEFSNILEEQIIATNVKASLILSKAMYIIDHIDSNNKQSTITKEIGNVTKETEVTFEFALRDDSDIDLKVVKELPFQLIITYDAFDGKYLRVLTQLKKLTDDKKTAENYSDRTILASHYVQTSSHYMQKKASSRNLIIPAFKGFQSYIKKLNPIKNDNFSVENYAECVKNLDDIQNESELNQNVQRVQSLEIPQSSSNNNNNFYDLNDNNASAGYKLARIKAKDLKKK